MEHNTLLPTCGMLSGKWRGKWRVERHENLDGPGHVWCAFHNEHNIEETHRHFPTWGEALDYADQQARTVAVTLPRSPKLVPHPTLMPKRLAAVYSDFSTGPAWWLNGTVHAHELHNLALALLALAARNGVKQ